MKKKIEEEKNKEIQDLRSQIEQIDVEAQPETFPLGKINFGNQPEEADFSQNNTESNDEQKELKSCYQHLMNDPDISIAEKGSIISELPFPSNDKIGVYEVKEFENSLQMLGFDVNEIKILIEYVNINEDNLMLANILNKNKEKIGKNVSDFKKVLKDSGLPGVDQLEGKERIFYYQN